MDGHALSLAQYRGKLLVLTFWAWWSDRSTEQLELVRKLQGELSGDNRVAFLGVNLDQDSKTFHHAVEALGYKWPQAELDPANLAKAAMNFEVKSLPAIYVVDPDGRIVGAHLEADRLRVILERELKN